jgi:hypothetical protein
MTDDEKCVELAKISVDTHKTRQGLEWKMLLGLWAAMALPPWFVMDRPLWLSCCMKSLFVFVYISLLLIVTFLVILPLQRAHRKDRLWLKYYTKRAIGDQPATPSDVPWYYGFKREWAWAQILITALLVIVAIGVLVCYYPLQQATRPKIAPPCSRAAEPVAGRNVEDLTGRAHRATPHFTPA